MYKSANFTGQPIFSQLLFLIPRTKIFRLADKYGTDRYYKKFKTYDHLVTMLYTILHRCSSLREVTTGMQICTTKLRHLGLKHVPRRSTFADANSKRNSEVFKQIYLMLYRINRKVLPDSRKSKKWYSKLYIVDSTTIGLFQEILKNAGRTPLNGKRKGGVKAHTLMKAEEDVPCLVKLNAASSHDTPFIQKMKLPKGSIVTFDKAYNDYTQYELWSKEKVTWVTRLRQSAVWQQIKSRLVSDKETQAGVIEDQEVILGHTTHKNVQRVKARRVRYIDKDSQKEFVFITNNLRMKASTIAQIYQKRWQIEVLFKRIKQNFPLSNFLGDNENAIRIQIWCALIADLIINLIKRKAKRKWSFANLSSMIRIHLMTYTHLIAFLNNPDLAVRISYPNKNKGPTLFD